MVALMCCRCEIHYAAFKYEGNCYCPGCYTEEKNKPKEGEKEYEIERWETCKRLISYKIYASSEKEAKEKIDDEGYHYREEVEEEEPSALEIKSVECLG